MTREAEAIMELGLKGRVALVTGSSQGIGKAIAFELSKEGAIVTICARNEDVLKEAAKDIHGETGNEVLPIKADLTKSDDIDRLVETAFSQFGRIDILINNTGGPPSMDFVETSGHHWGDAYSQLMMSTINACSAVIPHMQRAKWGRIINMTSFAAKQPADRLVLSNAVRAGILGLSKSLSNELAPYGILVNAVCPGWTLTKRVEDLAKARADAEGKTSEEIVKSWESQIPLKRIAQPHEIASLVVFLASERASYITGAAIQVDGGMVKGLY
jgi:3-oxoacyl-[acyl-carrier protein] reductase